MRLQLRGSVHFKSKLLILSNWLQKHKHYISWQVGSVRVQFTKSILMKNMVDMILSALMYFVIGIRDLRRRKDKWYKREGRGMNNSVVFSVYRVYESRTRIRIFYSIAVINEKKAFQIIFQYRFWFCVWRRLGIRRLYWIHQLLFNLGD